MSGSRSLIVAVPLTHRSRLDADWAFACDVQELQPLEELLKDVAALGLQCQPETVASQLCPLPSPSPPVPTAASCLQMGHATAAEAWHDLFAW